MKWHTLGSMLWLIGFAGVVSGEDVAILVGGGDVPMASEVSIERNTAWIASLLKQRKDLRLHTLFADGEDPAPDSYLVSAPVSTADWLHLLFGDKDGVVNLVSNQLGPGTRPSDAKTLTATLGQVLSRQNQGETFLIYQGHGLNVARDTNRNYLRLWGPSQLEAKELAGLFKQNAGDGVTRFLFPQCFSGAFVRLIYRDMTPRLGLTDDERCGFVSQLEFLPSEGCTPSVNEAEYRDYATYFFEALAGEKRGGGGLSEPADYDGDGRVGLREAHLYTLRNAASQDYPMASSEAYLLDWQRWYSRWLPASTDPQDDYLAVARHIATRMGLGGHAPGELRSALDERLRQQRQQRIELDAIAQRLDAGYQAIKKKLAADITERWPQAKAMTAVSGAKWQHPQEEAMRQMIDAIGIGQALWEKRRGDLALLSLDREIAQILRAKRMLELARLRGLFGQLANAKQKAEYQRLLACEGRPLQD